MMMLVSYLEESEREKKKKIILLFPLKLNNNNNNNMKESYRGKLKHTHTHIILYPRQRNLVVYTKKNEIKRFIIYFLKRKEPTCK
jgi:hypothetical protein